ncbi:hypothetical protein ACOMHN_001157 [Nucella lapillus]
MPKLRLTRIIPRNPLLVKLWMTTDTPKTPHVLVDVTNPPKSPQSLADARDPPKSPRADALTYPPKSPHALADARDPPKPPHADALTYPPKSPQSLDDATDPPKSPHALADATDPPKSPRADALTYPPKSPHADALADATDPPKFPHADALADATDPPKSPHADALTYPPKSPYHGLADATDLSKSPHAEALAEAARQIFREKSVVLFTLINDAYLDFAASWLCNTGPISDVHAHVLFLTTDVHTASTLKTLSSDIHVVSLNASHFSGNQVYSHAGYVRLMVERTWQILSLLEQGMPLLLFEVDCVWLSSPLPLLTARGKGADILATRIQNRTAGGFLLLHPTPKTLTLWRRLTGRMDDLFRDLLNRPDSSLVFWELNDQEYLSDLIKDNFGGVRVSHLPEDLFPDGMWYYRSEAERGLKDRPLIINNNFVSGNRAKKERDRRFGHWFLTDDSSLDEGFFCNSLSVHEVLQGGL